MSDTSPQAAAQQATPASGGADVLRVEGLKKHFPVHRGVLQTVAGHVKAVDGISDRKSTRLNSSHH